MTICMEFDRPIVIGADNPIENIKQFPNMTFVNPAFSYAEMFYWE